MSLADVAADYQSICDATLGLVLDQTAPTYEADFVAAIKRTSTTEQSAFFIVQDRKAWTLTLEDETEQEFEPVGFRFALPPVGENGLQELTIAIDNTDRRITEFLDAVKDTGIPVEITYRPYLSNDTTQPHWNPPLVLFLRNVSVNAYEITGQATFADIINKKFPIQLYTRVRFPSLGE